jgi:benzoyl-CoA reductase/2-hydroxyglutaryl-CoA dehydratase subunit BcrC/BadD/HgdB
MKTKKNLKLGFTCAYTPMSILDAAGFLPFRVLPVSNSPDQAGHLLHDNLCPHVKRVLDRALENDLPEDLAGMVFMNSCDAMRRLADAWIEVRPDDRVFLLDLPTTNERTAMDFFSGELSRFAETLAEWTGRPVTEEKIVLSVGKYNELSDLVNRLNDFLNEGKLEGSGGRMQELINLATSLPVEEALNIFKTEIVKAESVSPLKNGIPVFLFGNVMPDPEFFSLFESCGVHIAGNDFCTGTRMFSNKLVTKNQSILMQLSRNIIEKPPCARSFDPIKPGSLAENVYEKAKACGARGIIGHTLKFCDPYLARLPMVRDKLQDTDIPLLLLEGDCTLRSIGQQRTRIEAFVEMLR